MDMEARRRSCRSSTEKVPSKEAKTAPDKRVEDEHDGTTSDDEICDDVRIWRSMNLLPWHMNFLVIHPHPSITRCKRTQQRSST